LVQAGFVCQSPIGYKGWGQEKSAKNVYISKGGFLDVVEKSYA
jgi:hypothetical protein